jgi:hypothetical protein
MKFFGPSLSDFKVELIDNRYKISAPMVDTYHNKIMGTTVRYFNLETDELDYEEHANKRERPSL